MNFHTKYMKTNADKNFSIINTKIVIQARWLMPAYQEFTEMKWETYLLQKLQTLSVFFSFKRPMVLIK